MKNPDIEMLEGSLEEETPSGLLVPSHAIEREKESWTRDEVKKVDRVIEFFKKKELEMVVICQQCKKPLQPIVLENGRVSLRCKHKDRELRRDV